MTVNNFFRKPFYNQIRITILLALVFVLTTSVTIQSQQQSNALDIDDLSKFKGLSDLKLDNSCVAFKCNNQ